MAAAFAKLKVGRSGLGAAHASYITRMSALDPDHRDRDQSAGKTLAEDLDDRAIGPEAEIDADPIWTWNVPTYITGDTYSVRSQAQKKATKQPQAREPNRAEPRMDLKEKIDNARFYFGSREEFEKAKGGRTHYRMILSFDVPATNTQIRELSNEFLEQTFPKAMALAAIHRDTEHPHVHIYIHARQIDGRKVQLRNDQYRTIDEKWSKIYGEFAGDRSVHADHIRKKEETRDWKRAAAIAYRNGQPIPPKPERDEDRREHLAEQRLSAQRSAARDRGQQLGSRPPAEPVKRPRSEKETARLIAKDHLATEHLAHLMRTDASGKEIQAAARTAQGLKTAVGQTVSARERLGRTRLPAAAYTIEEGQQLIQYRESRDAALWNDRSAARLFDHLKIAQAELIDARGKEEAFEGRRHLWKFDVEGWDDKLSLKDIERAIEDKKAERLRVFNFIRPSRRSAIEGQIQYLGEVKSDVQKQLAARAWIIDRNVKTAELRREVARAQVRQAAQDRAASGLGMPAPRFTPQELERMADVANRNRDADLLRYIHQMTRPNLPTTRERAEIMAGRSLLARLEMLKANDRMQAAHKYRDVRQVPIIDAQGLHQAKSLEQVEPRSIAEALIRFFTDSPERRQELQQVRIASRNQVERSQTDFLKARDYFEVREEISRDYCRAAGVKPTEIAPRLTRDQIEELKTYAEKLPDYSTQRMEFNRAIPLAEEGLKQREAAEASRVSGVTDQLAGRSQPDVTPREERDRGTQAPSRRGDSFRGR
jgi:hypothetical protein